MPVSICARRDDKLQQIAEHIRAGGGTVFTMIADVTDAEACKAFIAKSAEALGGLHAVYANAGYGLEMPIHQMTDAQLRELFEVNFFGSMNLIRPALDYFLSKPRVSGEPRGHILWCSSCVAKMALPFYGAYSATKAAQNHLGRAMRLELEPQGVQVSTVHPITTRTEFFGEVKARSGTSTIAEHSPDWFAQDAETVAYWTVRCLRHPVPEVWTGFKGLVVRLGMAVNTFFPGLADMTTRGMVADRERATK